jgi:7,8-dihydro-6-hydroxymethylpterin dimethyltransferase
VLKALEAQTNGLLRLSDFVPVPCCMPSCNFVTYAMLDGDAVLPITRFLAVDQYLDYLKNRTLPGLDDELLRALERLWSSSAVAGSERATADIRRALGSPHPPTPSPMPGSGGERSVPMPGRERAGGEGRCAACHARLPLSAHTPRDLARHVFMINTRDFMDPWTFNVKNVMKCCVEFLIPDGRMIPFCAYNSVGYREQVTAQLQSARIAHDT